MVGAGALAPQGEGFRAAKSPFQYLQGHYQGDRAWSFHSGAGREDKRQLAQVEQKKLRLDYKEKLFPYEDGQAVAQVA